MLSKVTWRSTTTLASSLLALVLGLALSALVVTTHAADPPLDSVSHYCSPSGSIKDTCCEYKTIDQVNEQISPFLNELVKTSFFKFFKVNLNKGCRFWKEEGLCGQVECAVTLADESEIPDEWKASALSNVDYFIPDTSFAPFQSACEFNEKDFCVVEDESNTEGVYVNLLRNPEQFTGYAGESSARIWTAVYQENCFSMDDSGENLLIGSMSDHQRAQENSCTEKRVFYMLLSGLHSSISTHICDRYFDQRSGKWIRNLDCFVERVGKFPDRVQNLYFTYVVYLRAVTKLAPYLRSYSWCSGAEGDMDKIKSLIEGVVDTSTSCPRTFDETLLFAKSSTKALKEEMKSRFRNISMIMDCVGCEKCRLWGKLQVTGLGTALKILFSYKKKASNFRLTRFELVALVNGFARLSNSMNAINRFRGMLAAADSSSSQDTSTTAVAGAASSSHQHPVHEDTSSSASARQPIAVAASGDSVPRNRVLDEFGMLDLSHVDLFDPLKVTTFGIGLVVTVLGVLRIIQKSYQMQKGTMELPEGYVRQADGSVVEVKDKYEGEVKKEGSPSKKKGNSSSSNKKKVA